MKILKLTDFCFCLNKRILVNLYNLSNNNELRSSLRSRFGGVGHFTCYSPYISVIFVFLSVEEGQKVPLDDIRHFFYINNDGQCSPTQIVRGANGRCNQENLNEQLKNSVKSLRMPVDSL